MRISSCVHRSQVPPFPMAGLLFVVVWAFTLSSPARAEPAELLGRWDLVVQGREQAFPSWFEVRKSGNSALVGRFVGQFGSARPISEVIELEGEEPNRKYRFAIPPQWEQRDDHLVFTFTLKDGKLQGETSDEKGQEITWTGARAPTLKRSTPAKWGTAIDLIQGDELSGWGVQLEGVPNGWRIREGVLINAEPGNNLVTEQEFSDFQLHAEFRYPPGSNSGIYLRGRYEVQIEDNYGGEADSHKIGGVYGFLTPSVNAAKRAGQWQTYDITLVGRTLTVVLNGERVIDRQVIPGITGGALDSDEGSPGPLMLQGDHGPVEFRKLTLTPAL